MRTATGALVGDSARLRIVVDGREAGEWTLDPENGDWQEPSFTVPAELVRSDVARIEISSPDPRTPFHYWFLQ